LTWRFTNSNFLKIGTTLDDDRVGICEHFYTSGLENPLSPRKLADLKSFFCTRLNIDLPINGIHQFTIKRLAGNWMESQSEATFSMKR